MTVGLASAHATALLNVLRNTTYTAIAAPAVAIHIGDPGAAGTANPSVGSTDKNAVTWNAPSAGAMTLNTLSAWTNGGATETISHLSIWTATAAGSFVQSGALTAGQAWVNTNTLTMTTLTLSYTPLAA